MTVESVKTFRLKYLDDVILNKHFVLKNVRGS